MISIAAKYLSLELGTLFTIFSPWIKQKLMYNSQRIITLYLCKLGVPLNDNKTLKGPCICLQYEGIELNAMAIEATLLRGENEQNSWYIKTLFLSLKLCTKKQLFSNEDFLFTSRRFSKTAGGIVLGSVAVSAVPAVSADVLPYISVAIKASFLKLGMCNIYRNNIAKMFLDFLKFKIVHLIEFFLIFGKKSSAHGISKTAGWIFTKFALEVHLSL